MITTTRNYYNTFIDLFRQLCAVENDHNRYNSLKIEIANLIDRIRKFNLFQLTFTEKFYTSLYNSKIEEISSERLEIIGEIYFELLECLDTRRLHYGGELMFYLYEIKINLMQLSLSELRVLNSLENHKKYLISNDLNLKTENDKLEMIKELKRIQKKTIISKEIVKIKKSEYVKIELELKSQYENYASYIQKHYNSISENFEFYNKWIRCYITQAISRDIFELRIYGYDNNGQSSSLSLIQQYFDFCPAYFFNLEEISKPRFGSHITSISRKDFSFHNVFSKINIHHELIQIFLRNATEKQISDFISFLLKCDGHNIIKLVDENNLRFDITSIKDNKNNYYEIFHHKSRNMKDIVKRIVTVKKENLVKNITYIFTTFPGSNIIQVLKNNGIGTLLLNDLIGKHFDLDNSEIIHWYIQSIQNELNINQKTNRLSIEGDALIKRLENCEPGEKHWSEYEEIGIDIFRYLFEDNFKKYMAEDQFETDLKNHRRDLIVSNYFKDSSSFWSTAKSEYNSNAIIVDFKNYSTKLSSTVMFSVTKYMTPKLGNFAIIFSRKGVDKTALIEQKSLLLQNKLIIEFDDLELKEMIREKIYGKDPSDRLKSKEFDLIKT